MQPSDLFSGVFGVILALFVLVLCLLWLFLPFIINGISKKLDILISEIRGLRSQQTQATLSHTRLVKRESGPQVDCPYCHKKIPKDSIHTGDNTCPHCKQVFEVGTSN